MGHHGKPGFPDAFPVEVGLCFFKFGLPLKNMWKGKPLHEQIYFIFSLSMCLVYIGVGTFFIRNPDVFDRYFDIPVPAITTLGIACIVYAIFRGVRLVRGVIKE